uniref:X8 domain-containing protein n=1 Tax=Brassica oleracea TaxID=3712 RepID=A0A3P6GUM5_BRAOL|nr:unnamed protein product [Brassica oleracea]
MSVLLPLCLVLSMITYSNAAYCVCKDGNEQVLQKAIDYACGAGADCSQIQQNGACFQPNTVKNHCDVAVNSYYQKKASSGATCDFNGAAVISSSPPSTASSCLTGSSSSGTPSTGTPTTGTPSTGTPTTGTPSTGTPTTGTPSTGTPTTGTPSTGTPTTGTPTSGFPSTGTPSTGMPNSGTPANGMPTSSSSSVFPGTTLGPTGSGGFGDPNAGEKISVRTNTAFFLLTESPSLYAFLEPSLFSQKPLHDEASKAFDYRDLGKKYFNVLLLLNEIKCQYLSTYSFLEPFVHFHLIYRRRRRLLTEAAIAGKVQAMEKNQKKGHNKKGFNLKKHKKADPRQTNKGVNDEKPVLFQLGSIAMVSDARLKADPEITNSIPASPSLSSSSSSGNNNAKERKLSELQSSSNTFGSQVSGVTHASSVEPALLSSPSVQLMDREGSDQVSQRNSLPILERSLSAVSNDSLFSLSIGDNGITRDELFSYRDFKAGELLKSSELLSFCPSVDVPVDSSDIGKSFDLEDKASELLGSDSDDKSSTSEVSWRNLGDNSDEAPSSTQSVSSPITKKKKKKKKVKKKNTQQQKKRCSWLCCKDTGPCFSCCQWPNCDYDLSCCKRLKYCLCCCGLPQCCFSSCSLFFCCLVSFVCCYSSSKKLIDDEIAMQKPQKAEVKTSHKWFCCFPCCAS